PLIHPASWASPFDLHVLSTPPAFILSQDQTLHKKCLPPQPGKTSHGSEFELTKRMSLLTSIRQPQKGLDLIQRNLTQPKLGRGYLAFDKCTLLSSQGSDAPTHQPTRAA